MNTEFRFNGTSYKLVLSPTTPEEKQLSQLFFNGRNNLEILPSSEKEYVIQSSPTISRPSVTENTSE